MKLIVSEFAQSYANFSFGYTQYALREKEDSLEDIYTRGFLPDSSIPNKKGLFYMARSARIKLDGWKLNSENRRIAKRFDNKLKREMYPISEFDTQNKAFLSFCLEYFNERHGPTAMPKEKLTTILNANLISNIITYRNNGSIVGYVFEVSEHTMGHFWYSFYDLSYVHQSLGMWLMVDALREAQKRGIEYYYLGTVYGDKALYKTNFDNLEYWTGINWSTDSKKLRARSQSDEERSLGQTDEWKSLQLDED